MVCNCTDCSSDNEVGWWLGTVAGGVSNYLSVHCRTNVGGMVVKMKSIDELENDMSNNLACSMWDEVFDEEDSEHLICPWCGTSIELDAEEVGRLSDLNEYKTECAECGKTFYFRPEHSVNLYSKREYSFSDDVEEFY